MSNEILDVVIPQLGVNDDTAIVTSWMVQPGDHVVRNQVIAEIETSKATFDLECEYEGYIHPLVNGGTEVSINQVIALISPKADEEGVKQRLQEVRSPRSDNVAQVSLIRFTNSARKLAEEQNIDLSQLPTDRIIRESDIRALLKIKAKEPSCTNPFQNVVIYGASQGGLVILECLRAMGGYQAVAFIDKTPKKIGTTLHGLPVWPEEQLETLRDRGIGGVVTHIANRDFRMNLLQKAASLNLALPNVIHPQAVVLESVRMGVGNLIKSGAVLDTEVQLGNACLIDNGVIVPHHNQIGDACHLAPGVRMGGDCRIGERTLLGTGCVVSSHIRIGKNVIVAPGSCVVRDIDDDVIVEGSPARVVGKRR